MRLTRKNYHSINFNSLAPCGANRYTFCSTLRITAFQLTRPVWGEPRTDLANPVFKIDFNSLAPCGANPLYEKGADSTSAFQLTRPVWGEPANIGEQAIINRISTHSPRVGRTRRVLLWTLLLTIFQLTRPVWGEPVSACQGGT